MLRAVSMTWHGGCGVAGLMWHLSSNGRLAAWRESPEPALGGLSSCLSALTLQMGHEYVYARMVSIAATKVSGTLIDSKTERKITSSEHAGKNNKNIAIRLPNFVIFNDFGRGAHDFPSAS